MTAPINTKDTAMLFLSSFISFRPNQTEKTVPLPIQSPVMTEVRKVIREYAEPAAASAPEPNALPTMNESAIL